MKDFRVLIFRAILICAVISVLAELAIMRGRQVKELDQKVTELQSKTASLEIEIVKRWGMSSIILMTNIVASDPNAHDKNTDLLQLESDLNGAVTIEDTFVICDRIVRRLKERYDAKDFDRQLWILKEQIDEYKRIVGMSSVHPNSNL